MGAITVKTVDRLRSLAADLNAISDALHAGGHLNAARELADAAYRVASTTLRLETDLADARDPTHG